MIAVRAGAGELRVAGHDVAEAPDAVRAAIGVAGRFAAGARAADRGDAAALSSDLRHIDARTT